MPKAIGLKLDSCVRQAPRPRKLPSLPSGPEGCNLSLMPRFERLLCPIDFSECSDAALEYALNLAERFDGHVDVLHAQATPASLSPELSVWADSGQSQLGAVIEQHAQEQMKALMAKLEARFRGRITAEVVVGEPVLAILERAAQRDYDLIVLGTHGRTGLAHLVLGSVAERVLRRAPCAVLTVRAARSETAARRSA
jgi:universal stress protein A